MADIPFPLSSAPGRSPGEGAGRLLNAYAEALGPEATSAKVLRRCPGLKNGVETTGTGCRGFLEVNGLLFAVIGTTMFAISDPGPSAAPTVGVVSQDIDVFIIGGQSNADGAATDFSTSPPVDGSNIMQWRGGAIVAANAPVSNANLGSAWSAFGNAYFSATGRRILFVPCAVGGSSQSSINDPVTNWDLAGTLFSAAITKTNAAIAAAILAGFNPQVKGVLWDQGEADAGGIDSSILTPTNYWTALVNMIGRFRAATIGGLVTPDLPFYIFRTGTANSGDTAGFVAVRDRQEQTAIDDATVKIAYRGALTFPGRGLMQDVFHYLQAGYNEMGYLGGAVAASDYVVTPVYNFTEVGSVPGTKKVFMARNNKTPDPDKVLVTENGAFVFTSTSISAYPDVDLPQPVSVCFQDGYFFFPIAGGRCFASGLNDTTINALTVATAEAKPDGLTHAVPFDGRLLQFGPYSTEFWTDEANPPPGFPYSRATSISRGLVSATAIAGQDNGFGGLALIWVADDNTVVRLNGYTPEKISPPDLDHLIEAVADKTTLEACVYVSGGHSKWALSSPTWTWEFDLGTQKWNERDSYGLVRWRATQSVWAFSKWLVGDTQSGIVFSVDAATFKEGTNALRYRIESGPVQDFPARKRVARVDFDFATGVGVAAGSYPTETDPVVDISWSDDGGSTWSYPVQRALGRQGRYFSRVSVFNCGLSGVRGRRWRLDVSSPVYVAVTKGVQAESLRAVEARAA